MSGHDHLTPTSLEQLLGTSPEASALLGAATHLAEPCPVCWAVLERTPPPSIREWVGGSRPPVIREALIRQLTPATWPETSSDHLEALFRAKDEGFGFARAVAEEAAKLSETSWEPLSQAIGLAEHLGQVHGSARLLNAVLSRVHAIRAKAHVHHRSREPAERALMQASRLSTPDHDVPARIHLVEARAFYSWRFADLADARRLFLEALDLTWPERPIRHLEILMLLISIGGWSTAEKIRRVTKALELGAALRATAPDVVRAHALYRTAGLVVTALHRRFFGEKVPSFAAGLAEELEAAADLFAATSKSVQAKLAMDLATLRFRLDPDAIRSFELLRRVATFCEAAGFHDDAAEIRGTLSSAAVPSSGVC